MNEPHNKCSNCRRTLLLRSFSLGTNEWNTFTLGAEIRRVAIHFTSKYYVFSCMAAVERGTRGKFICRSHAHGASHTFYATQPTTFDTFGIKYVPMKWKTCFNLFICVVGLCRPLIRLWRHFRCSAKSPWHSVAFRSVQCIIGKWPTIRLWLPTPLNTKWQSIVKSAIKWL